MDFLRDIRIGTHQNVVQFGDIRIGTHQNVVLRHNHLNPISTKLISFDNNE